METTHSLKIFTEYVDKLPGKERAFDLGCGIGRVTKHILSNVFTNIDLLDQSDAQITEARNYLSDIPGTSFYAGGMQDHIWNPNVFYDCIWLEWFLMYLTDDDLVKSLKQCAEQLTNGENGSGLIVIKENVKEAGIHYDSEDNSVIRSIFHFECIFDAAGLKVIHSSEMPEWP